MAETISLEALERFLQTTKDASLQVFVDAMKAGNQTMADMSDIAARVGPQIAGALQAAQQGAAGLVTTLNQFGSAAQDAANAGADLWNHLTGAINDYVTRQEEAGNGVGFVAAQTALVFEPLLNLIPEGITGMGDFGKAGQIAGTSISESFKSLSPILAGVMGQANIDAFGRLISGADRAYQVQRGLISLAASQGQLNSVIDEGTNSFQTIDMAMTQMSDSAYESAIATGQSVHAMMNLAEKLGTIPGALSDGINVAGQFSSQLTVTSQIAAAFGQSQTDVAKTLTTMYDQMGLHGTESLQVISRMYEAAGDSKLRFEGFSKSVMDIASSFKMLGDNTNAATTVVKAFDTAFKDSEISPAAMQQVISRMASGIEGMDRGRQAFISAANGGPGGLAGSFQIELALQEGRMDEVMQKTMVAMQQQFGGQVLTLKDAADNPALAGEFYKQVQYLTQVAGVAKDDREAYRILEAMKSGVTDMLQPGAAGMPSSGPDALQHATERGAAEQQRTTSAVVRVEQVLERTRLMQSNELSQINTTLSGTFGLGDRMGSAVGTSGSFGVQSLATTEGFRRMIAPMTEADRIHDVIADVEGSPAGGFLRSMMNVASQENLETTPVGAGITLPGAPARAPAGPGAIMGAPAGGRGRSPLDVFAETGNFPPVPVTVEHSPIQVKVDLGEPFDRAVTTIVRREIQDSNAAQNVRANGGT